MVVAAAEGLRDGFLSEQDELLRGLEMDMAADRETRLQRHTKLAPFIGHGPLLEAIFDPALDIDAPLHIDHDPYDEVRYLHLK